MSHKSEGNNAMGVSTHMEPALTVSGRSGSTTSLTGRCRRRGARRAALLSFIALLALIALASSAGSALAAFGDGFGIAPINSGPGANEPVPAYPDADHAFWAGACDRATAPGLGVPIEGGVGARPTQILVPDRLIGLTIQRSASSPEGAEHCVDTGAPAQYPVSGRLWNASPFCEAFCPGLLPPVPSPAGTFAPNWRLAPVVQAGAHPDGSVTMALARDAENQMDGQPDNILVDLPPGFVGNPNAVRKCTAEQFASRPLACPPETQVGILRLNIMAAYGAANLGLSDETAYPLYNLEPRKGEVAEIGFGYASGEKITTVRLVGKARTAGDFGVTAFAAQIPAALPPINQTATLWGIPWASSNDVWRSKLGHKENTPCSVVPGGTGTEYIPPTGLTPECRASYDPSWGDSPATRAIKPFLTQETDCNPSPVTKLTLDSYQNRGRFTPDGDPDPTDLNWKRYEAPAPAVTGCANLPFAPDISFSSTSESADGATGLHVELGIPQNNDPMDGVGGPLDPPAPGALQSEVDDYVEAAAAFWRSPEGLATAHLKDTVVELPPGMSVNPSAATGLQGCSDAQIGVRLQGSPPLFNNGDPFDGVIADGVECPQGSILGTVRVETPLLDEALTGEVVLGQPKSTDPTSGEMFRLFLVVRNVERGLVAKIYGSTTADPQTGRLTTRFLNNPELPFDKLTLDIGGGERGLLAHGQRCGNYGWTSKFAPWSAAHGGGGQEVESNGALSTSSNCGFGFSPSLEAGMDARQARSKGAFSLRFARQDGEQRLRGVTAKLPQGLLASVRGVPLCTDAQANAGACSVASQIGIVDAKAGSGDPFVLERKGRVYLTEGYKGGEYGLAVEIHPVAGPFRGAVALSPIIVRQAVHIDRRTAEVTAVSDPLPLIHHGIPLRVREVTVIVDRSNFMLNPSGCSPKQVQATILSAEGVAAEVANLFQVSDCAALAFKPKLKLRLTGRKQLRTGKHPGVRAQVTQRGVREAGIDRARVVLPKSLALDPDNAQALCEFTDGTKPDLENHCPKGSIVGRVRAVSPLLNRPLRGNVYFVKNVRIDKETGNEIRTLPMIIAALRGEIAVNLYGESATTKNGRLVNKFNRVPDAPIRRFNLNIRGGRNGILAVTRTRKARINICRNGRQTANTRLHAHNNKNHNPRIKLKTPCNKNKGNKGNKGNKNKGKKR